MALSSKCKNYPLHAWQDNRIRLKATQGEGGIKIAQFTLLDDNGAINLSSATSVTFDGIKRNGHGCCINCKIVDATNGIIEFVEQTGITDISGNVNGTINVVFPDGNIKFDGITLYVAPNNTTKLAEASQAFSAFVEALNKLALITPEGTIAIDDILTDEGVNAVQGKAIKAAIDKIKSDVLSDEVNLLNIIGISDSSNDYFIKTIENNTVMVTSAEGDKSVNMILTLDNGRITCKGTTGNRDLTIKLSADFERNGEYLFALQNQQSLALGYPRVYIGKQISDNLIYGVNKTSYKSVNLTSESYKTVYVTLLKNSSFNISFNLSLTRSVNIKPYLPYNVNPKLFINRADYYNDTVYPHMFGAVGDGVTDDTAALQLAIDYAVANKKLLKLSGGCTYLISNTLSWSGAYIRFDGNNATIKVADTITPFSSKALNSVIKIDNLTDLTDKTHSRYILRRFGNVNIDCNCGRAVYGIYAENGGKTVYQNIMINNPEFCALRLMNGNEAIISNVHACQSDIIYDDMRDNYKNSAGIYLSTSDNYVENCVSVDFVRGFATGGTDNHFSKCHAWNAHDKYKIKNSISFDVLGGYSTFSQCTVDSTKYGYYLHKQEYSSESARACIIGGVSAYNSIYVNNYAELGSPTLFYFAPEHTLKGKAVIVVSSNFKATAGINCNFDNLTDDDGKIYMDRLMPHYENNNEVFWQNVHTYNIEQQLNGKADKTTTLEGYGITDAYTKDEVDNELAAKAKNAYQIAVENGFVGTEEAWLESLKGEKGKDGINGKDGKDGINGTDGRGIISSEINANGELVLTYSDGSTANVGIVVGNDYVLTDTDKTEIANIIINEYDSSVMAILGGDSSATE